MKRSHINWNETKWNKFISVVDECVKIVEKTEHQEIVEDISDIVMLCKKRMERVIKSEDDWDFRKTMINTKYTLIKREFRFIDNHEVHKKLARWWR